MHRRRRDGATHVQAKVGEKGALSDGRRAVKATLDEDGKPRQMLPQMMMAKFTQMLTGKAKKCKAPKAKSRKIRVKIRVCGWMGVSPPAPQFPNAKSLGTAPLALGWTPGPGQTTLLTMEGWTDT